MSKRKLVVVASNLRPMDAEMMRLRLESLGIEVFIQSQMVFSAREADLGGGTSSLLVPDDRAEEAVEALRTDEAERAESSPRERRQGAIDGPELSPI